MGDDGFAFVLLETGNQRQRGPPARLCVGKHLRAIHPIERERRAVDVLRTELRSPVHGVDAPLRQTQRRARRQVVHMDDGRRLPLDGDRREATQLTPDPAGMKGTGHAGRWTDKQWMPFARRTPFVIRQRVVVEEVVVVGGIRVFGRLADENFPSDVRVGRRMRRVVIHHLRSDAFGRRVARGHPVRGHHRYRFTVGDELLHGDAGVVHMGPAIRPVLHDVMVVGHLDVVEVDGAELRHFRDKEIRVFLPARASRIRGTALGRLQGMPPQGQFGRDHELLVDLWKSPGVGGGGRGFGLSPERRPAQDGARGDARGGLQEGPPGRNSRLAPRFAHSASTYRCRIVEMAGFRMVILRVSTAWPPPSV